MKLTTYQAFSLARVCREHEGEVFSINEWMNGVIEVEFDFPTAYRIAPDGRTYKIG